MRYNKSIKKRATAHGTEEIEIEKKINTLCPYCGSHNVTIDADIRVSGELQSDGTVAVKPYWADGTKALNEAVAETCDSDIQGYCSDCGEYCGFDWVEGYIPDENKASAEAMAKISQLPRP